MCAYPTTAAGEHNQPVQTVSELSRALKRQVEAAFDRVRVRGEVSGLRRAGSGHLYLTLKDADSVLKVVIWRSAASRLPVEPEDGLEVIAAGRLTTYPGRSEYQLVAESVELAGEGALLRLLEERRRRLAAEGLFTEDRKRPLPFLPMVIGVVTSPTGAVLRDILHRLNDRFPRRVVVWPVLVQGEGSAEQVATAIRGFDALPGGGGVPRPDVLIVARGGGSLEDLWAFNEEIVVRAAADCSIPLIAAVGHETDTTLIDFAADRRAPTPTAAAEIAVPVRLDLLLAVTEDGQRLTASMRRLIDHARTRLAGLARGLPRPQQLVEEARQRLDDRAERLANSLQVGLQSRRDRLGRVAAGLVSPQAAIDQAAARLAAETRALDRAAGALLRDRIARLERAGALLESYSYQRVLERGFVLVTDADGHARTSAKGLTRGTNLDLRFHDGQTPVVVAGGVRAAAPTGRHPAQRRRTDKNGQGSLW